MTFFSSNIYSILVAFSILHMVEEFVYPGGFDAQFKQMMFKIGVFITNKWLVVTNILFISVVCSTLFTKNDFWGLSVISITLLNGVLHIGKSIYIRKYFPGSITAFFLYLPTGVYSFLTFNLTPDQKSLCLLCGLLMHLIPFTLLPLFLRNKTSRDHKTDF